jgi:ribonuclease HII
MRELAPQYPEYGFERHVGYGTKAHLEALKKFGPCPIHRQNYEPIKNLKENIKVIC